MNVDRSPADPRAGLMLVELLVTLVILGIIGTAITGLFLSQSRIFGQQTALREARAISQGALGIMHSELRMVDATGGVVAATGQSVSLRIPHTLGMVCTATPTTLAISLFPTDHTTATTDWQDIEGYAWRDANGVYHYHTGLTGVSSGVADCHSAGVSIVPDGSAIRISASNPGAPVGAPVILYQRITYDFRAVSGSPGSVNLWRKVEGTDIDEVIGGPYDAETTGFRYYVLDKNEPEQGVPANLTEIRGLELVLNGRSSRPDAGGLARQTAEYTTAIFFHNN